MLFVLREFKTRDQNVLTKVTKPVIEFGSYFAMVCVLKSACQCDYASFLESESEDLGFHDVS